MRPETLPVIDKVDVLVIGAGLAGLNAARLLELAGIDYRVVEARPRLGGRILTLDGEHGGYDLGPTWFWPEAQPEFAALVDDLGVATFAQHGAGDALFERASGQAPERFSLPAQGMTSMRVVGGAISIIDALAGLLPPHRLRVGTRVTAMTAVEGGVEVALDEGDDLSARLRAGLVVATVPPRLLAESVAFFPPQDRATASRWQQTPTWMAPHAKLVATYDRPFWREAGLSGMAQSMIGPMSEIHDASPASSGGALFGFIGLSAQQRRTLGEDALKRACTEQLGRLFGPEAERPRSVLLHDWAEDPFTAVAADAHASGHPVAWNGPWVSGPWDGRLQLAGSEVSPVEPGYLAGAALASSIAVDRLIAGVTC